MTSSILNFLRLSAAAAVRPVWSFSSLSVPNWSKRAGAQVGHTVNPADL